MNKFLFEQLLESLKQATEISRGQKKPKRSFHYEEPDIKKIRHKAGLSQSKFAKK